MKLNEESYKWSVNHLHKESDTDLFPKPYELQVVKDKEAKLIELCKDLDIDSYKWRPARRFIIPKDNTSYRVATQLDIFDSILLGAIVKEFGHLIENRRVNEYEEVVFSYRFKPTEAGVLYSNKKAWSSFWESCRSEALNYEYVVMCDISDFYNQIYLHTIENQLGVCGFTPVLIRLIKNLIVSITQRNSRGIPVGPHVFHLFAEMSLIPIDNSFITRGIKFKRYADDMVFFCSTEKEARIRINQVAEILDKQQRLVLQNQKTNIYNKSQFIDKCRSMLTEEAGAQTEKDLISIIDTYADGDSYTKVRINDISDDDLAKISKVDVVVLLDGYLKVEKPKYEKIRWLYRRLAQIGLAHAVDYSIDNFDALIPAINDVCLYLNSCAENYESDWKNIGDKVLALLKDEIVESNQFYKISLLSLFVYNAELNHFHELIKMFDSANGAVKREILLASLNHDSEDWIRELKESFPLNDNWAKRAYLLASENMPREEREFFFKGVKVGLQRDDIMEHVIIS
ncbi:RNA-directed DNA polymerase [Hymenobacter gummosus]|uniref:RNA-directed DNA polymerase n=1 Tax=Hymenobacter gummosus TaxID=1776032 RepID=A0A431TYM5_9BACT|nr:RNA-directed DNA polymerase [Hymenobacter gummosus]RTQ46848.1 RNA-directed DNA polymerase [Hymenobacter gummosus]